jgi:hypothetical protein
MWEFPHHRGKLDSLEITLGFCTAESTAGNERRFPGGAEKIGHSIHLLPHFHRYYYYYVFSLKEDKRE